MPVEYNTINKIKATENDAVAIRQAAIETGRAVITEAERRAAVMLETAAAEAEAAAKRIIKEASGRAAEHTAVAAKKAEEKAKSLIAETEPKLDTAAAVIIERILK
ncbi:MAG: hypothetical protein ACYCWE_12175 [Eubacteriales bacterium]